MPNSYEMESYSKFEQSVLDSAEKHASEIMVKSENYRRDALRGVGVVPPEVFERRRAEIVQRTERRYATVEQDMRRELLRYREELTDQLFEGIKEKLNDLSENAAYLKKMAKRLDEFTLPAMRTADEGQTVKLFIRPQDREMFEKMMRRDGEFPIVETNDIEIGGFRLQLGRILHDCTLDLELSTERTKFYESSGIKVD